MCVHTYTRESLGLMVKTPVIQSARIQLPANVEWNTANDRSSNRVPATCMRSWIEFPGLSFDPD